MSQLLNALTTIVGGIIAFLIIWGTTDLICKIFSIDDDSLAKALIRLVVLVGFFVLGAILQKKLASRD